MNDRQARQDARDAEREMRDAVRLEPFALSGLNRLVKVIAIPADGDIPSTVSGYVTQERFILGKTPMQIQKALGVEVGSLVPGCIVLALQTVPGPSQIDYELTTNLPGGLAPSPLSDPKYPPFAKKYVHQWRLRVLIRAAFVCRLGPSDQYKGVSRKPGQPQLLLDYERSPGSRRALSATVGCDTCVERPGRPR